VIGIATWANRRSILFAAEGQLVFAASMGLDSEGAPIACFGCRGSIRRAITRSITNIEMGLRKPSHNG
jgi:hypothetical protein